MREIELSIVIESPWRFRESVVGAYEPSPASRARIFEAAR